VPGLVTDVAGLLLLLRPTRALVRRRMVRDAERHVPLLRTARIRADGTVIDGEVVTPDPGAPLGDRPALPRVVRGDAYVVEGEVVDGQVVDAEIVDEGPGGSRPLAS
jgi:UPF0716 protein FxsA